MANNFKIFISYRRKGGYDTAKLIYDRLRLDGYSVSFDLDTLESGNFDYELEKRVKKCKDFLLILNPGIFDCFSKGYNLNEDWVYREIVCAIQAKKNIIPLVLEDFAYPKTLPPDIKDITRKNVIDLSPKHFEAAYEKLKDMFLLSKPHWKIRHKKPLRSFLTVIFFAVAAYLFFTISATYKQKELEAQEAKIALQKADSIRVAKEVEMALMADSIKNANEAEMASAMARAADSVKQAYMNKQSSPKKPVVQSAPPKPVPKKPVVQSAPPKAPPKAAPQKPSKKTLHWSGSNDKVGQAIFNKISTAGVRKTKCSGNGVVVRVNNATCTSGGGKYVCSYSPKMTFTTCNGKMISSVSTSVKYRTSPQTSEAKAREELASELRRTDFSSWISAIRGVR